MAMAQDPTTDRARSPELYDEQMQRKRQEKAVDPGKRDDEQKAARAEDEKR